jgi:hypothetical protein
MLGARSIRSSGLLRSPEGNIHGPGRGVRGRRCADPIVLGRPVVSGSRISVEIRPGGARGYLGHGVLWVQYSRLENLATIDEGILILPALGTVLTVAYALGLAVETQRVDASYATAAEGLTSVFQRMYPGFSADTFSLRGDRVTTSKGIARGGVLLFSGGVDSTASLIAHWNEEVDLLTVWGADVKAGDWRLWKQLEGTVLNHAITGGRSHFLCQSNLQDILDGLRLSKEYSRDFGGHDWWGAAQHGIALASIAIPVAAHQGREQVYIASSVLPGVPWGSTRETDGRVRWSSGRVVHDQHDLSRQRKLAEIIGPHVTSGGEATLAVCYQLGRGGSRGLNCGFCEKCLRTITGLLACGIAPASVGLPFSARSLAHARRQLANGRWAATGNHWAPIQAAIPATLTGIQTERAVCDYLQWLRSTPVPYSPVRPRRVAMDPASYLLRRLLRRLPFSLRSSFHRGLASSRSRIRDRLGGRPS